MFFILLNRFCFVPIQLAYKIKTWSLLLLAFLSMFNLFLTFYFFINKRSINSGINFNFVFYESGNLISPITLKRWGYWYTHFIYSHPLERIDHCLVIMLCRSSILTICVYAQIHTYFHSCALYVLLFKIVSVTIT